MPAGNAGRSRAARLHSTMRQYYASSVPKQQRVDGPWLLHYGCDRRDRVRDRRIPLALNAVYHAQSHSKRATMTTESRISTRRDRPQPATEHCARQPVALGAPLSRPNRSSPMRLIACAFALAALPCMLSAQSTRRKPPRLARNMSNLRTLALSIGLGVASALPVAAQVDSTWT